MLDLKLRLAHRDRAVVERLRYLALLGGEQFAALVPKRADRDDGQARVDLDAGDGIARRRADERLLEILVGDRFGRAHEARAELDAGGAHVEIAGDRLAPADAAGDEHRHRSEEHTSELQSLMRTSNAAFCLK